MRLHHRRRSNGRGTGWAGRARTAGLAFALGSVWLLAGAAAAEPSAARLDAALRAPVLRDAALSVLVVDRASGATLYERSPARALLPASTQKLLTAIAALDAFGPGHRFVTEVLADAPLDAQGAVATLYVRGGGDASMTSEQWWRLAADLAAMGVRRVGELVLDDTVFDDVRWHPSWVPITARAYHGPIGGLTANYGAFRVIAVPGRAVGDPVGVRIDPPIPYFELVNEAETRRDSGDGLRVERFALPARDRIVVTGTLPPGAAPKEIWRSVSHPRAYAGGVLRWQLEANGIAVGDCTKPGSAPEQAVSLLAFEGHPMRHVVGLALKFSSNMIAESLVKALGRAASGDPPGPGTWAGGMAELRRRLEAMGISLAGNLLVDGSGLSRDNRVSARLLVDALRHADARFAVGPDLVSALPMAGVDGTLRERAERARARVRAKTGSLDGVTALAGFAQPERGDAVVFAVLVNGYRGSAEAAMDALDGFLESLVSPPREP